ncbi:MAG: STT3 domain-containing protein, partial [Candidatus Thermoplasmatota archaeon]|nr:STT3 domain-containing protein [Candidatus Thermoplasmatota archaeon]
MVKHMLGRRSAGEGAGKLGDNAMYDWVKANWVTIALVLIFLLALFVRSAFAVGPAVSNSPVEGDFVVSGGSDSYYHKRIVDYIAQEGRHFMEDPLLNFPQGAPNPRPGLWHWTVVTSGYAFSPFFGGDINVAVWSSFLFSTAFWGALTVIPLYFIGKCMFGKKTGLAAAFLLALSPAHMQLTVLSNGDHDSWAMFLAVLGFYFFIKAISAAKHERWVEKWFDIASMKKG